MIQTGRHQGERQNSEEHEQEEEQNEQEEDEEVDMDKEWRQDMLIMEWLALMIFFFFFNALGLCTDMSMFWCSCL